MDFFKGKLKVLTFFQKHAAFTLAEVLITLGVIGIVAAMTIPTLINKANEKATVVSLKKEYSILSSAYTLAVQENGSPETWTQDPLAILKPFLKVSKDCSDGSSGCFAPGVTYRLLNGGNDAEYDTWGQTSLQLTDGVTLMYQNDSDTCSRPVGSSESLKSECGQIYVDINGNKKPNQWGEDAYIFHLTKLGIVPFGTAQELTWPFSVECQDDTKSGFSCSGWLIYNENMGYTHCSDLAWDGKHKCS